jgi:hypothetical protein
MNELLVFIPIAILFLVILLYWTLRTRKSAIESSALADAEDTLSILELELPPRALAEKIFSTQDWDFVSRQTSVRIQRTFLAERRTIALFWLCRTRRQAARLMGFYRRVARANPNLSPAIEIRVAANYALFLLVYEVLLGWIWLGGPLHARKMARCAIGVADHLWVVCEEFLASVDPVLLHRATAAWADKSF